MACKRWLVVISPRTWRQLGASASHAVDLSAETATVLSEIGPRDRAVVLVSGTEPRFVALASLRRVLLTSPGRDSDERTLLELTPEVLLQDGGVPLLSVHAYLRWTLCRPPETWAALLERPVQRLAVGDFEFLAVKLRQLDLLETLPSPTPSLTGPSALSTTGPGAPDVRGRIVGEAVGEDVTVTLLPPRQPPRS